MPPESGRLELEPCCNFEVTGDNALAKALARCERRYQFENAGQTPNGNGPGSKRISVATLQVISKSIPRLRFNLDRKITGGKDFLNDSRIGIAVGNYTANVSGDTEGLEQRVIERDVAVLRAH